MEKIESEHDFEKLPVVRFEKIDLDREVELAYSFMKSGRWSYVFDEVYPKLREIQQKAESKTECIAGYKEFFDEIHSRNIDTMTATQEQIKSEWEKIGPTFTQTLSEHFDTEWSSEKEIVGYVSALPAYPRFLDDYSFCIGYKDVPNMIETAAHEILHFLWFKKWKEVFPEIDREEYESPHLVWRLSEIIDPIILQCHPKIKELIKPKRWGYPSFDKIKIGEVSMTDYFKDIYLKSVESGDNFETTMKKLWDEAQKHREEISGF